MVATGLNATLNSIGAPLLKPPTTPPALLVLVWKFFPISSLCWLPSIAAAENPEPISNPFTALMLNMAFAKSACSLSNTGSPNPTGTPVITAVTVPPVLSFSSRTCSMYASISPAA